MLRRILIVAIWIGLSACAARHAHLAQLPAPAAAQPKPPPMLAQGLWAILDPGCPKPVAANIHKWPACASPFWISRGKATVICSAAARSPAGHADFSFAADYQLAGGDPLIAQVGDEKDGYLFLALTELSTDDQGRLIGAMGAAIACPKPTQGALVIKPILNGCDSQSAEVVRQAAAVALQDHAALNQVAWIAPGAP